VARALSLQPIDEVEAFLIAQLESPRSVSDDGLTMDGRCFVVDALADLGSVQAVGALTSLLSEPDPYLRGRVDWALGRLTNSRLSGDWSDLTLDAASLDSAESNWKVRLEALSQIPPEQWFSQQLSESGFTPDEEGNLTPVTLTEVIGRGQSHQSLNAQLALMRAFDRDVLSPTWPRGDASWYWREVVGTE